MEPKIAENLKIGVDFGGTKIEAIALAEDGRELSRRRIPTPRDDYDGSLAAVAGLVEDLEAEWGGSGSVGLGIPGCLSPATGLVKNANSTWLIGRDLKGDLERRLARPLRLVNDANCLAVSEAVDGAGAGADLVFAVILGTGVGGGIAIKGEAWVGPNAVAGEWGHNPLPWPTPDETPGPPCYCGKLGCIETFLSGPGLARDHAAVAGASLTAPDIIAAFQAGDDAATASYRRYGDRLARGLASVIDVLDPDVIVLGGGLSNVTELYADLPPLLQRYVFSDSCTTPVRPALHGDSSGVRGAAWLWG